MASKASAYIQRCRFFAVLRAPTADLGLRAALAAHRGGARIIEVTLTVPEACKVIAALRKETPDTLVGAGTVLSADEAARAMEAGAEFVVSPILDPDVVQCCRERGVYVVPGANTPTEIASALRLGVDLVKIFPADLLGGPAYLRALRGPFPHLRALPTGGIDLGNAAEYLNAGAAALGVSTALFPQEALLNGDYARIEGLARRLGLICQRPATTP